MAGRDLKIIKMVLTIKNCKDLVDGLNRLNKSMDELRKKYTVLKPVVGAFVSREITHSAEGWHVHAHLIAICDEWLPNRMEDRPYPDQPPGPDNRTPLEDAWLRCTGDSFMVHTSLVRGMHWEPWED